MSFPSSIDTHIKIDDVMKLLSIFKKLGWRTDIAYDGVSSHKDTFEKFCQFLVCLDEKEIDLVLTLTEDFLHCPSTTYPQLAKEALLQIPEATIDSCGSVFFIPLINPDDLGKTKSSTGMLYGVLRTVIPTIKKLHDKNPISYDNPILLLDNYSMRKNSLVLFFDDFIGSGDTAIEALKYYNDNIKNKSDIPIVVSLVAQSQGKLEIENYGFTHLSAKIRDKCITDSVKIADKSKAIEIIRKIENRMGVEKEYRLGYKKSEALVSMMRIPDNTLPLYWWEKKPNGEKWSGIFTRD